MQAGRVGKIVVELVFAIVAECRRLLMIACLFVLILEARFCGVKRAVRRRIAVEPVAERAECVETQTLRVKKMAEFVADKRAKLREASSGRRLLIVHVQVERRQRECDLI